jgi:hypothetical protein
MCQKRIRAGARSGTSKRSQMIKTAYNHVVFKKSRGPSVGHAVANPQGRRMACRTWDCRLGFPLHAARMPSVPTKETTHAIRLADAAIIGVYGTNRM